MSEDTQPSKLPIISLVFSLLLCIPFLPFIGVILGILGLIKSLKHPEKKGLGISIAAIAIGLFGGVFSSGIMAAVAVPAFIRYIRVAKTAEAASNISQIFTQVASFSRENGRLPASTPLTPDQNCCLNADGRCPGNSAMWQLPSWREIGFSMQDPHYFRYQIISEGNAFNVRAVGDLDCDDVYSSFERSGALTTSGEIEGSTQIQRTNPTE